jgi:uroporphyrinogen-III decarboxylase
MTGFGAKNRAERTSMSEWDEGNRHVIRQVLHTPRGDLTSTEYHQAGLNTVWRTERLLKTDEDVERYLSLPQDPEMPDLAPFATVLERLGDRGIPLVDIADPICIVAELFEFSEFMLRAFTHAEQIIALLDHVAPAVYRLLDHQLDHGIGPLFRIFGAEYVTPPYLPPPLFERFVVGYTAPMIERIHARGCLARLHCHGYLRQVLPMIVEMGADALDPVEAPPSGDITLAEVKRLYGEKLCLFGNLQLRDLETLPAADMRRLVQQAMAAGKLGGGFVIMPTASPIDADLSPITERNYRVFIEVALELGGY